MAKCEICGKGVTFGIKVSHSHRRSNRTWKPNVKRVKAIVKGTPCHMYVCSRCLRSGKVDRASGLLLQLKHGNRQGKRCIFRFTWFFLCVFPMRQIRISKFSFFCTISLAFFYEVWYTNHMPANYLRRF